MIEYYEEPYNSEIIKIGYRFEKNGKKYGDYVGMVTGSHIDSIKFVKEQLKIQAEKLYKII